MKPLNKVRKAKSAAQERSSNWPKAADTRNFKKEILAFYLKNRREFAWRQTKDPYHILVSEIMLQQTQASRVLQKYPEFLRRFPSLKSLADAKQSDVLKAWQGLGYNRRALNLKRAAEIIIERYSGNFPKERMALEELPGIGQSTSGAILNFAYNIPTAFIETNIRVVFLYLFFKGASSVSDKDIGVLIERTLDRDNPRDWFYALYDYGAMLKATLGKERLLLHKQSKHYNKQSVFEGSNRQIRSLILQYILKAKKPLSEVSIASFIAGQIASKNASKTKRSSMVAARNVSKNLLSLEKEGFIEKCSKGWRTK